METTTRGESPLSATPCSAFSDSERLSWLIRENAYSLIDPSWAREGEDPQAVVRERIDKHMIHRPNVKRLASADENLNNHEK
jgi:hypothetical protein